MDTLHLADRLRLMIITDERLARPHTLEDVVGEALALRALASEALAVGVPAVQLRLKGATAREMLDAALKLLPIVRTAGGLFIVNDRLDVALAAGADGVHLGPDDPPVPDARAMAREALGTGADAFVVGHSVDSAAEAARSEADGANYLGVGAVYATANKSDAGEVIGIEGLRRVVEAVSIPVVAIGGITPERAPAIAETGACGCAVIGAVMGSAHPADAVRALLRPFGGSA